MTRVCSLSYSTADVNDMYHNKRLPKGIHVIGADEKSVPRVEKISYGEETDVSWGYFFVPPYSIEEFVRKIKENRFEGDFVPKCFIYNIVSCKRKPNNKVVMNEEKPSEGGFVFLQGKPDELNIFLQKNFPRYHLVANCMTGKTASIKNSVMQPFMKVAESEPQRVTFLRAPFEKFAKEHVKLRVLTGILTGLEGYVVRILRDRQFVMDFGGNAVAISNVHNEDFQIAE